MKRTNDRGLTVLEIFLGLFLAGLLGVSVYTLHRRKAQSRASEACNTQVWFWSKMAEELESKLHQWEILGAKCVMAQYPIISPGPGADETTLFRLENGQPLVADMPRPNVLFLPSAARFTLDQEVLLCTDDRHFRGRIAEILPSEGKVIATLDVQTSPLGNDLLNQGSQVIATRALTYRTVPSENYPEKILYEKRSATEQVPIGSGFETWSLKSTAGAERGRQNIDLNFSLGGCSLKRNVLLAANDGLTGQGRWWIRGDKVEFEPWYEPVQHQP